MSSELAIRVDRLSKCYQIYDRPQDRLKQSLWRGRRQFFHEFWAMHDVSFQVARGETVGIIGRNGSGKSTLLQMICATLTPTAGEIAITGRVAALLELGAGFNPEFTGRENARMNAALLGLTPAEIDARIPSILAFADIGEFVDQPVKTYSSGMFVRLAFAVIAHVDADILIVDEALAVGDGFFTQKCMRFLRQFRETGTLLFVSHDTSAVLNLCDRAIWLERGALRLEGPAKAVCEAYLADISDQQRRELGVSSITAPTPEPNVAEPPRLPVVDQRLATLDQSRFRNDIEIFSFQPDAASHGSGGARVLDVELQDARGAPLSWAVGGHAVQLAIQVEALIDMARVIVGFFVKDRLGQLLFGDNTFLTRTENPLAVGAGERFEARFGFNLPILPPGEYSVDIGVAEGTQAEHVHHCWAHDALLFRAHTSSVTTGLVGIPMTSIALERIGRDRPSAS
ncbi:ABC transporter ATP-binding protein [Thiocystis violascens]|uniref:ABC-type polysaccharide/polyol phosphate transport system, ATPase component n=1 Tax=Thiocystis violascens (strain ATCC 17096 / DSM 198 / 6111) TaxID=765911 RepID=I3YC79_THIV6|nr:ABC transporter ATP-binding protein [Thiocystis violascens]AFL74597.1 ABC-type polysaccharide/polyol phosphate transport system, ATPase component [Thiocystis violascens DSM 198]